ncbi:hypothetical protein PVAP13_2NG277003, partial [Panicum virgatum]
SSIAKLLPPLARSSGRHLLSGTVTTARMATGTHLHQIDGYSLVEGSLVAGESVSSSPFLVGGRWWQLLYYPNGMDSGHRGFVSAELLLAWGEDEKATASYRVSILDHAGLPAHSGAMGPRRFWGRYGPRRRRGVSRRLRRRSSWGRPPSSGRSRRSSAGRRRCSMSGTTCSASSATSPWRRRRLPRLLAVDGSCECGAICSVSF